MQERWLGPELSHLPAVRSWVREAVAAAGPSEDRASVLDLLTTELVSDAIRHGDGQVRVRAGLHGDQVVVAVRDTGPGTPPAGRCLPTPWAAAGWPWWTCSPAAGE